MDNNQKPVEKKVEEQPKPKAKEVKAPKAEENKGFDITKPHKE